MGRFPRNIFNTLINMNSSGIVPNRQKHVEDLRTIFDKLIDTNQKGESKGARRLGFQPNKKI